MPPWSRSAESLAVLGFWVLLGTHLRVSRRRRDALVARLGTLE